MIKYTILYKNGKTWNGKAERLVDIPVVDCVVMTATYDSSEGTDVHMYLPTKRSKWEYLWRTWYGKLKQKKRTPNPNSKTKKQKAFDQAYLEWTMEHFAKYDNCPSVKEYKKWLWEQKNEKAVKVDKDGFIPWNGGDCPVQRNTKVVVKFKGDYSHISNPLSAFCWDWKHHGTRSDIVAYKVYEEELRKIEYKGFSYPANGQPIKTTYTFWLGATGEIVDDK